MKWRALSRFLYCVIQIAAAVTLMGSGDCDSERIFKLCSIYYQGPYKDEGIISASRRPYTLQKYLLSTEENVRSLKSEIGNLVIQKNNFQRALENKEKEMKEVLKNN